MTDKPLNPFISPDPNKGDDRGNQIPELEEGQEEFLADRILGQVIASFQKEMIEAIRYLTRG